MKIRNIFLSFLAVASLAFATSCSDDEKDFTNSTGITLSQTTLSMLPGDITELKATIAPDNATSKYMMWTSSNAKVASVDNFGKVCALTPGKTTITVKAVAGKFTATCDVTVNPIKVTGISLSKTSTDVNEGESVTLVATITPANATDQTVTWTSSDKSVATVDKTGKVTGVVEGTTTITATTTDGAKTASCTVNVKVYVPTAAETLDVWKSDAAGHRGILGGTAAQTKDFLSYSNGVVRWSANTTGAPRTATMEFSTGSKITVTQLAPADFKGNYSLKCKVFSSNAYIKAGGPTTNDNIVIGAPILGETLKNVDGKEYTNQLGVKGLYYDAVMDATAVIDYDAKTVKIGMFLDARDNAQKVANGVNGYNYACFLPGMGTGTGNTWASPWNFVQPELGKDQDYTWLWFDVDATFSKFSYDPNTQMQSLKTDLATSANQICAITVAISSSKRVNIDTVRGDWDVVYQGNKYATSTGLVFTKK
jgi:hypothetical protein